MVDFNKDQILWRQLCQQRAREVIIDIQKSEGKRLKPSSSPTQLDYTLPTVWCLYSNCFWHFVWSGWSTGSPYNCVFKKIIFLSYDVGYVFHLGNKYFVERAQGNKGAKSKNGRKEREKETRTEALLGPKSQQQFCFRSVSNSGVWIPQKSLTNQSPCLI